MGLFAAAVIDSVLMTVCFSFQPFQSFFSMFHSPGAVRFGTGFTSTKGTSEKTCGTAELLSDLIAEKSLQLRPSTIDYWLHPSPFFFERKKTYSFVRRKRKLAVFSMPMRASGLICQCACACVCACVCLCMPSGLTKSMKLARLGQNQEFPFHPSVESHVKSNRIKNWKNIWNAYIACEWPRKENKTDAAVSTLSNINE